MEDPVADAILNQWFIRLEQGLRPLPAERRAQIVEDLRAHVEDALRCEPDRSDATVLAVLDRVGDPDEIARDALADEDEAEVAPGAPRTRRLRTMLAPPVALSVAALTVAVLALAGGSSRAAPTTASGSVVAGDGWLPSGAVSGGGGVDAFRCSPQTMAGSESAVTLRADAREVASGTIAGHQWSAWAKDGVKGGPGLEEGGVIVDGVAHGLCDGFPNPAEMELLDPQGGGDAIAYGVVGYPGAATVDIDESVAGTFATRALVGSTTSLVANRVGFFITALSAPACRLPALELNTASASYATEHNFGFATGHCSAGELVPINDSQGIWQLPPTDFPDHYPAAGAAPLPGGSIAGSSCSPPSDPADSGRPSTRIADAAKVASGTLDGHAWTLWSKHGEKGSTGLEDAGVILDGRAYGLCAGFPNPAELELIDPSSGGRGIVVGVSGYTGRASVRVFAGHPDTFDTGRLLYSGHTVAGFFIGRLPRSACDYRSLELNVTARSGSSQHNLEFSSCHAGRLRAIIGSMGAWSGGSG